MYSFQFPVKMIVEEMTTASATTHGSVLVELPLGDVAPDFNLEKAVCSHGLFMMAPNHWDWRSKTLKRPLRLPLNGDETSASFMVHISHPLQSYQALHVHVFGTRSLSPPQHRSLLSQVKRMLRLSEEESKRVKEFHDIHEEAKCRGFGRVFRSPTLFEDMVKCILLCNCQWSRTLSMAQALCELQLELSSASSMFTENGTISSWQTAEAKNIAPKTPARKESKRKPRVHKRSINFTEEVSLVEKTELTTKRDKILESSQETRNCNLNLTLEASIADPQPLEVVEDDQPLNGASNYAGATIGNFPSPQELVSLDEKFLASRCGLGYRAGRVINLACGIVQGRIQLNDFEDDCDALTLSNYDKMLEKLRAIDGFGPFTCANVLMCIGFYHLIPSDSETIRHLKQVHAKTSTIRSVQGDVENIYGKYAPFQFLAYWCEVWHFYEEWFGNLSEMPHSNYRLITAANMKPKKNKQGSKKMKLSLEDARGNGCMDV